MFVTQITIEGVEGDVEIKRTETGAIVRVPEHRRAGGAGYRTICAIGRDDDREKRWAAAVEAAKAICGVTKETRRHGRRVSPAGEPNATNSMIHEVLIELERVAGC